MDGGELEGADDGVKIQQYNANRDPEGDRDALHDHLDRMIAYRTRLEALPDSSNERRLDNAGNSDCAREG